MANTRKRVIERGFTMLNIKEIMKNVELENNYTVSETAKIVGLSQTAVSNNIRRGNLKATVLLGRKHIRGADILRSLGVEVP